MSITPEQARAELQRRTLIDKQLREQLLYPPAPSDIPAKTRWAPEISELFPVEPKPSLLTEAYHAAGRGGLKAAASVPGTAASLLDPLKELARTPSLGVWAPYQSVRYDGIEPEKIQQVSNKLKDTARRIYKLSESEKLAAKRMDAAGYVVNLVGESFPQMGLSIVSSILGGAPAVIATSAMIGGEEVYQNLRELGVNEQTAEAARWVSAPIIGLIERWQVEGILKTNNPTVVKQLVQAAREKSLQKLAQTGTRVTVNEVMSAAAEGLQEALQEATGIGAEIVTGRSVEAQKDLARLRDAFVGGAIVGGIFRGAHGVTRAISDIQPEVVRAMRDAQLDTFMGSTDTAEVGPVELFTPEELQTSSAAADTAVKPRMHIMGEGQEVPAAPSQSAEADEISDFMASMWSQAREFVPGNPTVPTPQIFRDALVNRHIALYQRFDRSEPGGPAQRQAADEIYRTIRAINLLDGVDDPAEGRPFVPPEYEAAARSGKSVLEHIAKVEEDVSSVNDAFMRVQEEAKAKRVQEAEAYDWWRAWREREPEIATRKRAEKPTNETHPESPVEPVPSVVSEPAAQLPPITEPATPPPGEPFSVRNAAVAQVRQKLGLSDIPRRDPETIDQWRQEAIEQGIPDRALEIADEIITNPRPMTPQETLGFEIALRNVEAAYDTLAEQMEKAAPGSPEAKQIADAMRARQQEYDSLSKATDYAGTPEGRSLRARRATKSVMQDDTNVLSVRHRAEALKGDRLTAEEQTELETKTRELKKAVERASVVKKNATRRSLRKIGKLRYKNMTDADKDTEIADILAHPLDDQAIKRIAENIASRPDVEDFDAVVKRMQEYIPDVTVESVSDSIVSASTRQARVTDGLLLKLREIMQQARRNERLRMDIKELEYYLEEGRVPEPKKPTIRTETDANRKLIDIRDELRKQLRESEPAQAQRLQQQIDYLTTRLEAKDYAPKSKIEKPIRSPEIERLEYEVYKLRSELGRRIAQMAPKPKLWYLTEPFRALQAIKSSMDASMVMRQAGIAVRSAPIRSLKRLPEALRAMMNPQKAFAIQQEIENRPNAWLYHRAGLEFTKYDGGSLTAFEEAFQSDLASRIPIIGRGVQASNRAFATFLNLVRADSFDVMMEAFAKKDSPSIQESKAIANFINVMTGRGSFAGIEKWGPALNGWLWSPRFVISRVQFLIGQPLWGGTWRTRRIIAKECAKYLVGLWVTYELYERIFGGKVNRDPLSAEFGKLVVGNTRLDPLSGLSQTMVLMAREVSGKKTTASGNVVPIRGEDRPYGGATMLTTLGRWLRGKLGFLPGKVVDLGMGTTFTGEPVTLKNFATSMVPIPLGWQDIYKLMLDQGVPKGAALELLALLGEGLQVYETPDGTARLPKRRRIKRRHL